MGLRYAPRRAAAALVTVLLAALCLTAPPAAHGQEAGTPGAGAAEQVLTWTADNDTTRYKTAPETAVAGPATIVFENSEATGNTTDMPHTLTFVTTDPEHNSDVQLNILASPSDSTGGRHTAEVTLSAGTYYYHCTIPGHSLMSGVLVVTGDGDEDTTPPEVSAELTGQKDPDGAFIGGATIELTASDSGSGVERIEYALDGGEYAGYSAPVLVDAVGEHSVDYRAVDRAGNASEVESVGFVVVEPPAEDTTPPEVSAEVSGEQDSDGAYVGGATV
ncbi:cupredoxin domain-containing protein, partial [Streptomyces sp. TP-A0874]|uniref:cupredoxin domain-containing protein n=1 Tax=Streptomyces sp. TP-A0874 TaxID=549819 RepID=UPI001BAF72F8